MLLPSRLSWAPPGRDTSPDAAVVPPVPPDPPPPNENYVLDEHDTSHDLLMPPAELQRLNAAAKLKFGQSLHYGGRVGL